MDNNNFNFTYSAKEQEEIKAIRKKYSSNDENEDKMSKLRRLDKSVTNKANVFALVLGILGALILGAGMSLIMSDFSKVLNDFQHFSMIIGIILGIVGIILIMFAYPTYNFILKNEQKKIAPEILRLTDELMK